MINSPDFSIPDNSSVEDSLVELVRRTDHWIDDHADQFDPFVWSDNEVRFLRRKSFAEAGMYLHRAAYSPYEPAEGLRSMVHEYVTGDELRHLLSRSPEKVTMFGYVAAYGEDMGILPEETSSAFERTISRPDLWASEILPFRKLDLLHLCRLYGYSPPVEATFDTIIDHTCVAHQINPATISLSDAYGLTHVPMYYQNFGSGHERFPSGPIPYQYAPSLHGLILRYMAADNSDIVGELLLAGALERILPRRFARFVLGWYLEQVSADGRVSYPHEGLPIGSTRGDLSMDVEMGEWDERSESWARHYHPTFVGSTLGRVLLDLWPEIDDRVTERSLDYESESGHLLALGRAFDLFSEYKIEEGAALLEEIADTPTAAAFPEVVDLATQFLHWQRRSDGAFGYWTDEKKLFVAADPEHDAAQFQEELVQSVTRQCERTLEALN